MGSVYLDMWMIVKDMTPDARELLHQNISPVTGVMVELQSIDGPERSVEVVDIDLYEALDYMIESRKG